MRKHFLYFVFIKRGILYEIDGSKSIDDVKAQIRAVISAELSNRLFNLVIFGYPGSGRGSQGKNLAEKYGLEYVATGKMLEDEIAKKTVLGRKVEKYYNSGQLVPDEIVVQLIEKKLKRHKEVKGFIFKGFPRTLVQSYILDGMLKKIGTQISQILEIEVPTLKLIERLDTRSKTDKCMPYDSSTAKIVKRLEEHEEKTVSVIEKYKQLHDVTNIDGRGTFNEVSERIITEVEKLMRKLR